MSKICLNGSNCKFLKTPKGCKFIHEDKSSLAPGIYEEVMSALKQANCTDEGHSKNIGGRITSLLIDHFTYDQITALMADPREFAEEIYNALEVIEDTDRAFYVPVADE